MKIFKITEQQLQQVATVIGEFPAKHMLPIIDMLRALPEIAEGVETVAKAVEEVL